MERMRSVRLIVILLIFLTFQITTVTAQESVPERAVYVVQEGDSLWDIAVRFGVSLDQLSTVNQLSDTSSIAVGDELIIPNLSDVNGYLKTIALPFGETLPSLARRMRVPVETIEKLNHIISDSELYVGTNLIILEDNNVLNNHARFSLLPEESILESMVANGTDAWSMTLTNGLSNPSRIVPGDVLFMDLSFDSTANEEISAIGSGALNPELGSIIVDPLPLVQGKTFMIQVIAEEGVTISGEFDNREIKFFRGDDGRYFSLNGVHALNDPGLYDLMIEIESGSGKDKQESYRFSQPVYVKTGGYAYDPVLTVNPETIDPAVTRPEDAKWVALTLPINPEKYWEGQFESPVPPVFSECWPSLFGNRRSYNGSSYDRFHTGLDFCGRVGTEIFAPAKGKVVFAGPLTVRGNSTVIDHGWGVYSAYMHQSEIIVQVGDMVEPGQLIGLVGGTGRVTGPHLHWEIWNNGVQIDPMDWLENTYPPDDTEV
jgi:murein DD-endopeptidase MepM/ murein hydrolase activator NlpD